MRTLGQKRAEFALNELMKLNLDDKEKEDFKRFAAGAPTIILQNGFGQALAFFLAKGKDKHMIIFDIVKKWLNHKSGDTNNDFVKELTGADNVQFVKAIAAMNQNDYLKAQTETIKILEWVKRYAVAFYQE